MFQNKSLSRYERLSSSRVTTTLFLKLVFKGCDKRFDHQGRHKAGNTTHRGQYDGLDKVFAVYVYKDGQHRSKRSTDFRWVIHVMHS